MKIPENFKSVVDSYNAIHDKWERFVDVTPPAKLVLIGYSFYVLIGWLLLCLPIAQTTGKPTIIDHLFITTSAISTTGLVTVSISDDYNFLGQLIILVLIQIGGIGYMTFGSFVILSRKKTLNDVREKVGKTVFTMPEGFRIDKFIKSVIWFSVIIELIGAVILFFIFQNSGDKHPVWSAVFHSISAFCTAGFGLYNNSFEDYANNIPLNLTIAVLSYLGGIGFIVCVDVWRKVRGKIDSITLTSKIILYATLWLSLIGTALIFLTEKEIQSMPVTERFFAAFFQCMTAMTTVGFNTITISKMSHASVMLILVLMIIGASPSGTGGGIKSTSVSAIIGVMLSTLRGEKDVRFWNKIVPTERVRTAVASTGFYLLTLVIGTYLLELTEKSGFVENLFETASALGTVGLSLGITSSLTILGKIIITTMMFLGRVGPLTFGMAVYLGHHNEEKFESDDLAV